MNNRSNAYSAPEVFKEFIGAEALFHATPCRVFFGAGYKSFMNFKPDETDPVILKIRKVAVTHYANQALAFWVPGARFKPKNRNPHIKIVLRVVKSDDEAPLTQNLQGKVIRKFAITRISLG